MGEDGRKEGRVVSQHYQSYYILLSSKLHIYKKSSKLHCIHRAISFTQTTNTREIEAHPNIYSLRKS
jgi:hypothetical protein